MERIKKYFSDWNVSRFIRLFLAIALGFGFISTKENIYLFGAIILGLQVVLNISCPGGSCNTSISKDDPKVKVKKYEPQK